jgi:O-acetyl-ADP-ribose deacetylase (regulator of RNase III)
VPGSAGNLPAKWVIHAVGPIWRGGDEGEAELLASAYRTAFDVARTLGARTVASPSVSTGVYRFPLDLAAPIAVQAAREHLRSETPVERITFVLFSRDTFDAFEAALSTLAEK